MNKEQTANFENEHLKAWQLIIELIKHPFSEVRFCNYYITKVRYNGYDKEHMLDCIKAFL